MKTLLALILAAGLQVSAAAAPGRWELLGTGDCPGRDVASSKGREPEGARCTPEAKGTAAVCWDGGCTYKSIQADACSGGSNPGRLHRCEPGSDSAGEPQGAPDWIQKGSGFFTRKLIGVGGGMSRVDALAMALGELGALRKTLEMAVAKQAMVAKTSGAMRADESSEEQKVSDRLTSASQTAFGPIFVSKLIQDRMVSVSAGAGKPSGEQEVSSDVRVTMKSGAKRLAISVKMKSVTGSGMSKSTETVDLEVHGKDLSVSDLIKELTSQGIEMLHHVEPDGSYEWVCLKANAPPGSEELIQEMEEAQ